jgi:hypothetical protein
VGSICVVRLALPSTTQIPPPIPPQIPQALVAFLLWVSRCLLMSHPLLAGGGVVSFLRPFSILIFNLIPSFPDASTEYAFLGFSYEVSACSFIFSFGMSVLFSFSYRPKSISTADGVFGYSKSLQEPICASLWCLRPQRLLASVFLIYSLFIN